MVGIDQSTGRHPSWPFFCLYSYFSINFSQKKRTHCCGFNSDRRRRLTSRSARCLSFISTYYQGGSPGLVVMGGGSRSKGRGFESRRRILDGHFFTFICCKNCNVCLKRPKINEKEAGIGPFFLKKEKKYILSAVWGSFINHITSL